MILEFSGIVGEDVDFGTVDAPSMANNGVGNSGAANAANKPMGKIAGKIADRTAKKSIRAVAGYVNDKDNKASSKICFLPFHRSR